VADQPDCSDGTMLALYPPQAVADALVVPGGLTADEVHVTVAYTGTVGEVDAAPLLAAAKAVATRRPITANISGHARFTGGDQDVIVALIDSADLEQLRRDLVDELAAHGVTLPTSHGFCAHATIAYLDPAEPSPVERIHNAPVVFDRITVVHGTDRTDLQFTSPEPATLLELARVAYSTGWAQSGGPFTERVSAGCRAALALAADNATDPTILEVTLQLGALEGMWATLFDRREALITSHAKLITTAWRAALGTDLIRHGVDMFTRQLGLRRLGLRESSDDQDERDILAAATEAARALLNQLPNRPQWTALRKTMRDALAAGRAEGIVAAVAIAAEQAGPEAVAAAVKAAGGDVKLDLVAIDWNLAFEDAYQALDNLASLWADADGWLGKILGRATDQLGKVLADQARANATYEDMVAAAADVLDDEDIDAVEFVVDWAMTTAADDGALALYASEGVEGVDVITAGDQRVCQDCADAEQNSPYPPADAPGLPLHPLCRCCYAAESMDLGGFAGWFR
jgi:2'-5' RNA ligase